MDMLIYELRIWDSLFFSHQKNFIDYFRVREDRFLLKIVRVDSDVQTAKSTRALCPNSDQRNIQTHKFYIITEIKYW